jgi:hypothetical protein
VACDECAIGMPAVFVRYSRGVRFVREVCPWILPGL